MSWPTVRHLSDGIPSTSTNIDKYSSRQIIQGDHLQLLYFYWLFSDMVNGKTPWFHNLYEFNTGDDAARYNVGNYNIPFSLIYVFWNFFGTTAFAWNMLSITTIWLTYLLTWMLTRRYVPDKPAAPCRFDQHLPALSLHLHVWRKPHGFCHAVAALYHPRT